MVTSGSFQLLAGALRAIGTEAFETSYVRWLESCVDLNSVTAIAYFADGRPEALILEADCDETHSLIESTYLTGAYKLDPMFEIHAKSFPPGAYRLSDICPDQFRRTEYFTSYYQHTGTIDEIGMVAAPKAGTTIVISLSRHRAAPRRFSLKEVRTIKEITPTAAALAELHWKDLTGSGGGTEAQELHRLLAEKLERAHGVSLTKRQAEVALLVLKGHSSASIALILGLSIHTVRVFRKQIYARCRISGQAELFRLLHPLL